MSDVTIAPPSAAPASNAPAPQPQANEVQINQNPTNSQNAVGPQAADAPVPSRADATRDAVQRAVDRAKNMQEGKQPEPKRAPPRDDPKAAEARKGHNNPPEDVPTEKLDLKKRPSEQPRSERGTFAPRQAAQNTAQTSANGAQNNATAQLPAHAPYREPPPRFSEVGKKDWATAPESVRADVHRMHQEFGRAYQQYRGAAEAFQPVAKYHQMAQEHGTTLETALGNYVSMEQKLRADPLAGLDLIVHNLGLKDPETGRPITLRDVAYTVLSQSPDQLRAMQQGNQQNAASKQIGALHQEVSGLKQALHQMHTAAQFRQVRSGVDQFADSHPRFDELGPVIERELKLGFDLDTAYRRAELLYPATHAAQTRTASAQTRPTDRSIHGNPDVAPSDGASRKPKQASPSPRAALENAMHRLNGAH